MEQLPSLPRRGWVLVLWVAVIATLVGACGDEEPLSTEEMTLREMLGMTPEHVADLPEPDQLHLADAIEAAWEAEVVSPPESMTIEVDYPAEESTPSAPPMTFVKALDSSRQDEGSDVQILGRIDASGVVGELRPTPIPLDLLGLTRNHEGYFEVEPLVADEPRMAAAIYYDEAWGRVDVPSLGLSERDAIERLEPVFRRHLYQQGLTTESAQVIRAPQAPVVMWYASAHRALFVNPSVLYTLAREAGDGNGQFVTATYHLEPDYISACIQSQRTRCQACFGADGNPGLPSCAPLFASSDDPDELARVECAALEADEPPDGFALICYHQEIYANLGCFTASDPSGSCTAGIVPANTLGELVDLAPMVDQPYCQTILTACRNQRNREPIGDDDPPPPTTSTHSHSDSSSTWEACADCFAIGCEAGAGADCGSSDGGDGGGGCEGDGLDGAGDCGDGLCDGDDDSAAASTLGPRNFGALGLILGLPFLFLFAVYFRAGGGEPHSTDASSCADAADRPS